MERILEVVKFVCVEVVEFYRLLPIFCWKYQGFLFVLLVVVVHLCVFFKYLKKRKANWQWERGHFQPKSIEMLS